MLQLNNKSMNGLLYGIAIFMFVAGFLINNLGFSRSIMYVFDIFCMLCLLFCFRRIGYRIQAAGIKKPALILGAIIVCAVVGYVWNGYSIYTFINGVRTNLRFGVFFVVVSCIMDAKTGRKLYQLLYKVFWINVVLCSVQYFVFGIKGDSCNGLFGTGNMNSWTNILICLITAHTISRYLNKLISGKKAVILCVACMYIAILAELKFFYFELVFIVVAIILLNKPSLRTALMCIGGGVALILMISMFNTLWEVKGTNTFSIAGIQEYFEEKPYGYASVGDWGRIGGIKKAIEKFFSDGKNMFGFGLGYCGYGTAFHTTYESLHYIWFSYLVVFMEQGWIGLVLYYLFYASILLSSKKIKNSISNPHIKSLHDVTECMAILAMILTVYNSTITNYPATLLFLYATIAFKIREDDWNPAWERNS